MNMIYKTNPRLLCVYVNYKTPEKSGGGKNIKNQLKVNNK